MRDNVTAGDGRRVRPWFMVLMLVINTCVMAFAFDLPGSIMMSKAWANMPPLDRQEERSDSGTLAARAINGFGLKVYSRLVVENKNLTVSPLSVFSALAIAYEGARGQTRDEMATLLSTDRLTVPLHSTLPSLIHVLNRSTSEQGAELYMANALWAHKFRDYEIRKEFRETLLTRYGAKIRELDFKSSSGQVSQEINDWVDETTRGKIKDLISGNEVFSEQWVMAIVNAIYFRSMWAGKFDRGETTHEDFTLPDGSRIKTPMMNRLSSDCLYMERPTFHALELPYQDREMSMVVFLPIKPEGLPEFERNLTAENLNTWLSELSPWRYGVKASLPRFTMRHRLELVRTLRSMGMTIALGPRADFSGIFRKKRPEVRDKQFLIGRVIHEACIEVNEEGTEAAAATAIIIMESTNKQEPVVFRADHPFMFIIYHKPSGCILFMGRVTDPSKVN